MTVPLTATTERARLEVITGAPARRIRISPWLLFAAAVIIAFFGLIYSRISLDNSAFEIKQLEQKITQEEGRFWQLRYELARLQDPARIEGLVADLGLEYPTERVALSVPDAPNNELDTEYRWAQLKAILSAQP